jgi:hypothetical protein
VWTKSTASRATIEPAEKRPILRSFLLSDPAGRHDEDCYTFERFASSPHDIRTTYYYHYKEKILGLKEETTWS